MSLHLLSDVLRNSLLITGLVITMMIMIEFINISSKGKWLTSIKESKFKQILLAAFLGGIPGCMGGFAAVSLYTHRIISFGALIAMLIATSGDEAFVMLAMFPGKAVLLFVTLFIIAVVVGVLIDRFYKKEFKMKADDPEFIIHDHIQKPTENSYKWLKFHRIIIIVGLALFSISLLFGAFEHEHVSADQHTHYHIDGTECTHDHDTDQSHSHNEGISLLSERWMNILFAVITLITLLFIIRSGSHFMEEHIWDHVIKRHFLTIFLWTFGALLVIAVGLHYLDIDRWISDNTLILILIASMVGLIPESGPHLIFVTLYATGIAPFSVLLASSISQDGHAALPLLAESKSDFLKAKIINLIIAIIIGSGVYLITGL